jgi:hypothetical protein
MLTLKVLTGIILNLWDLVEQQVYLLQGGQVRGCQLQGARLGMHETLS